MANLSGGHGRLYDYSKVGDLWVARAAGADHTTAFTAQTAFDATTPFMLLRKAAEATFLRRLVPQSLILTPSGTAPGGKVKIAIFKDLIDRLSAGGTALGHYQPGIDPAAPATPTGWSILMNATAAAAGAGLQLLESFEHEASQVAPIQVSFDSRAILNAAGSILIYAYSAAPGPTYKVGLDVAEEMR